MNHDVSVWRTWRKEWCWHCTCGDGGTSEHRRSVEKTSAHHKAENEALAAALASVPVSPETNGEG